MDRTAHWSSCRDYPFGAGEEEAGGVLTGRSADHLAPMLAFGGTTVDGQAWDEFPTLASSSNRY